MDPAAVTPDDIVDFWFPDGPNPELEEHRRLWVWRMRGGANDEILQRFVEVTKAAVNGDYDDWAETAKGRLALIILLDQFPRTIWAGTPDAYAQDPKALALCLEGLDNGHFDALENVWQKTTFRIPLEHCECPDHLANLDRAVAIGDQLIEEAPDHLKEGYLMGAKQPRRHREVIRRFGRHAHRNDILGRSSTPEERAYIEKGEFPHLTKIEID